MSALVLLRSSCSQILVRSSFATETASALSSVDVLSTSGDSGASSFAERSGSLIFTSLLYDLKAIIFDRLLLIASLEFIVLMMASFVIVLIVFIIWFVSARGTFGEELLQDTFTTL